MKWLCYLALPIVLSGLVGCSDGEVVRLGPQSWDGIQFIVETRPAPVRTGMNEFIVIASRGKVKPGYDLIVSLRIDEQAEWKQAIQDGYTGVYRRAIRIDNPLTDILAVQVRKAKQNNDGNENETVLYFPLGQEQEQG